MSNIDLSTADKILKELYDGQKVEAATYQNNPFFALVKKNTKFYGRHKPVPVRSGTGQRSATFATAKANQEAPDVEAFLVTRSRDYALATIDNETLMAAASDKGAFMDAAELAVDSAFEAATNSAASALFRKGTGTIGRIGQITSGVITLSNPDEVTQFEKGQVLQANQTDGGEPRPTLGYVIKVNRALGTVTVSTSRGGSAGTPSGWAANDCLLVEGDLNKKLKGLDAWLTTPTDSDLFFGVNRSSDATRLAGVHYDGSAQSIEEAFTNASSLVSREGGAPGVVLTNFASLAALENSLGTKVRYVDLKGEAGINFQAIALRGANTTMNIIADRNCPPKTAYLLQMDTWELASLGEVPQILTYGDGNQMLRVTDQDAAEVRVGYYAQLICNAPGRNARVVLGA